MKIPETPKKTETYAEQFQRAKTNKEESASNKRIFDEACATVPENPSKASGWIVAGGTTLAFTLLVGIGAYNTNGYGWFNGADKAETSNASSQYGEHFEIK